MIILLGFGRCYLEVVRWPVATWRFPAPAPIRPKSSLSIDSILHAELFHLGHFDNRITVDHYSSKDQRPNPRYHDHHMLIPPWCAQSLAIADEYHLKICRIIPVHSISGWGRFLYVLWPIPWVILIYSYHIRLSLILWYSCDLRWLIAWERRPGHSWCRGCCIGLVTADCLGACSLIRLIFAASNSCTGNSL